MKKKACIVLFLIINSFFIINIVKADYQVSTGNIFHYDIVLNELTANFDGTEYYGNGFSIDGHQLDQGYTITLIVDAVDTSTVDSTIFGGGYSEAFTSNWIIENYEIALLISSTFSHYINQLMNPSYITNGPPFIFYPFIDTLDAYAFFEQFVYGTNFHLQAALSHYINPIFECESDDSGDIYYFESYLSGKTIVDVGPPEFNLDFEVQVKFAYEKNTGILQGMHYVSKGEGTFQSQNTTYICETLIEMQDYNLPKFQYGGFSFDITEDWWIIAVAGGGLLLLITILVIIVVVNKKKKKKSKRKSTKKKKKKK